MGKLDELRARGAGNAAESMGVGVASAAGVSPVGPSATPAHLQGLVKAKNVAQIPLTKIERDPDQPREEFDAEALERLALSMKVHGQLQPIRVRLDQSRGVYVVVVGERRFRAAKLAAMESLTCVITEGDIDPGELLSLQLVENLLRDDLKPVEQARAYRRLMEHNGWSTRQLAEELAIVQPQVVRMLALLKLPDDVQRRVDAGEVSPATAYELVQLDDAEAQTALASRVAEERLTRAETTEAVRRIAKPKGKGAKSKAPRKVTEQTYRTAAGPRVTVEHRKGLDVSTIRAALAEIMGRLDDQAAA